MRGKRLLLCTAAVLLAAHVVCGATPATARAGGWRFEMLGQLQFEHPPELALHSHSDSAAVLAGPDRVVALRVYPFDPGGKYAERVARLGALHTILAGPGEVVSDGLFPTGVYIVIDGNVLFTYARGTVICYTRLDGPITDADVETARALAQSVVSVDWLVGRHGR